MGAFGGLRLCFRIAVLRESGLSRILFNIEIRRPAFLGEMVDFCIAGGPKMISEGDAPCSNTARRGN